MKAASSLTILPLLSAFFDDLRIIRFALHREQPSHQAVARFALIFLDQRICQRVGRDEQGLIRFETQFSAASA